MEKFRVLEGNPTEHDAHIRRFWAEYMPWVPISRLNWLMNGNPAGPSRWLIAFKKSNNEIVGMVSLTPRKMYAKGEEIKAGILGDLMVHRQYRVFGPALQLVKNAIELAREMKMELLYTLPNKQSEKIIERAGFNKKFILKCLVKPLSLSYYLQKRRLPFLSIISYVGDIALKVVSRDTYVVDRNLVIRVESKSDKSFETLWEAVKQNYSGSVIGDRGTDWLEWKYFRNPHGKYCLLTCRNVDDNKLKAYAFCLCHDGKIDFHDVVFTRAKYLYKIISKAPKLIPYPPINGMQFVGIDGSELLSYFKRCMYRDANYDIPLYAYTKGASCDVKKWYFVHGDRNL